ncbi:right-handed parallel beta-helix repeat-containing protein [Spirosoma sp.]|uniref:right-handed parallel beta-helix repeat-containing protein n=1 Tax=Spirosoma sp. TaxID=1899569 RepID=UPI00261EE6CD|nr:right-handed parallel beta-helix repeat-containing protein [Spirosoma sp.]MCX6217322.1 right-handed parallel beta-helix repeat-containing protein [Spirosoma sp.]
MKFVLTSILFVISLTYTVAQNCDCDITISKAAMYDGDALDYKPGQTICIKAGNYPYLYFKNIVGKSNKPITIINCGGLVTVGASTGTNGIQFYDSKYVKLTGSGDSRFKYGFKLTKTPSGASGINVTSFSSDFEIEQVEVSGTGFAGIMIKMDPTCDPATWRGNFSMYNIKIHDNYVHDTYGEGMYIGNSFWNSGITKTCDGVSKVVYPHNIYGLAIYNNLVERTGAEGIQYGCAPEYRVYNNVVRNTGISPFATYQNNGIQASGGVSGRLYNNVVQNVSGNGIIILGHTGTNIVYNNLVTNIGGIGVFCDNRPGTPAGNSIIFANNTLVNCRQEGFALYNKLDKSTLANNAVIQTGSGKLLNTLSGVQVTQTANYYEATLSSAKSNRLFDDNYKPVSGSPLIDKGINNGYWGIKQDLDGKGRPKGKSIDIGAYEFESGDGGRLGADGVEAGVREVLSFPSPCINEVFLKLTGYELTISKVTIYTIDGKPVMSVAPATLSDEVRLETESLATGVYVYQVVTSDLKVLQGRFVKQ